jgi:cytoskeleton protein RodZ
MAKKRRNSRKKHNSAEDGNGHDEFLADVPEKNADEWSGENSMENTDLVDPYLEKFEEKSQEEELNQPDRIESNTMETNTTDNHREEEHFAEESESYSEDSHEQDSVFTLGAFLQSERQRLGISLKNVTQSTKISLTNLEYLEADDLRSLPDRAYVLGYVKSYAKLLGIDVNLCINLLDKTYAASGSVQRKQEVVIPQAQNSPKMANTFPVAKIAMIAAMIIIIVGVAGYFLTRSSDTQVEVAPVETVQEDVEDIEITPQTLNAETPLQDGLPAQAILQETTDETSETEVNEQTTTPPEKKVVATEEPKLVVEEKKEAKVEEVEKKKEEKKEAANEEEEKRKFYPLASNLYSFDNEMSAEKINELLPNDFKVTPIEGIQAVFITAVKSDSWLTYKSDDDPIKKFVLKKGRSLLFRAKEARVFLGNLGAVKIFLNNKPLIVKSRTGVKSLVFPQENAGNYMMPLFIYKEDGSVQTSQEWIEKNQ